MTEITRIAVLVQDLRCRRGVAPLEPFATVQPEVVGAGDSYVGSHRVRVVS